MKIETNSKKIDKILNRGIIAQIFPSKKEFKKKLLSGKRLKFYIGFDPTAPLLHLGHAQNFILMEKLRKLGHEIIILFGDFTARIGDPSGKESARQQLTREKVLENIKDWKKLIQPFINLKDKENPAKIMQNHDWLSKLTLEETMELATNFTVQQMIERDMFQKRLEEEKPIYLHEFLYPLMQGYDSVAMDVDVEVCGTDQIFNALTGRTLMKKLKDKDKFVVATKLLANPKTGEKMSKSTGTGVFIHEPPKELYGQIMAQPDEMIKILFISDTFLSLKEIKEIMKKNPKEAKMKLAFEITKIVHGEKKAKKAEQHFINVFQKNKKPEEIKEFKINKKKVNIVDLLNDCGLTKSKSEARRLIEQGGIRINDEKIKKEKDITIDKKGIILQRGKREFRKITT